MNRQIFRAAVGASLLNVAVFACAAETSAKSASPTAPQTQGAVGMRIYVDPGTGAMVDRPVTAQHKSAAADDDAQFNQDNSGLRVVTHPDGSISIALEGRFQMATQAHKAEDGSIKYTCEDAEHSAQGEHTHAQPVSVAPIRDVR